MVRAFSGIAFTDAVIAHQKRHGSAEAYAKFLAPEADSNDRLSNTEKLFITERDGFYQATVSETGWPYVQFRGGPRGFVHVLDEKTIAYADFRGNRQYLSVGNLSGDDRIALFFMDYANQRRLKMFGHAHAIDIETDPALIARLSNPDYRAKPERAIVIKIAGFDWNCPQHIPQRFSLDEIEKANESVCKELAQLRAENAQLQQQLGR
ncbi:pyridoxamine 5'-phosphate oxidase family protein [Hyphococcus sp.]|uniref:pyridoxamine 5'-phosphate oxidase family protein n=1 Tax=Hyphococcus sp. TaxID=2038636 RepID=UPI00208127B2|nr:MAG: pyridoxamine 5'-phosphate oxidase [Marinicaulis sp.]